MNDHGVILGIDPGSRITGYGLIEEKNGHLQYIDSGCIRTSINAQLHQKLLEIYDGICYLMEQYTPHEVAIEDVFLHQNPNSALKLGHARGAALVAAASHRVRLAAYAPREVKQAVVGYGAADKNQVKRMVMYLLSLPKAPQNDAADALAIAICHSYKRKNPLT